MLPPFTPRLANAAIDVYVLLFSAALSIVSSVIFGLAPALQTSKPDIEQTLRANAQSVGVSRARRKLSGALVIAEIAMAVILCSGAGLLIKNLWGLSHTPTPGSWIDRQLGQVLMPSIFWILEDPLRDLVRTGRRQVLENECQNPME